MTDTDRLAALLHAEFITHEMGKGSVDDTCSLCVTRAEHLIAAGVTCSAESDQQVAAPPSDPAATLREAAQALVDWYDGPPYTYVESEMEELIYAIKEALGPKMCGSCSHPGHWRECQTEVTGLLETAYACPCRHRGPPSPAPNWQAGYDAGYREAQEDIALAAPPSDPAAHAECRAEIAAIHAQFREVEKHIACPDFRAHPSDSAAPCDIEPAFSQHEYAVAYCETHDQPAERCPSDPAAPLREALSFIADWAHDCIDTGLNQSSFYGFDKIEDMARAALAGRAS